MSTHSTTEVFSCCPGDWKRLNAFTCQPAKRTNTQHSVHPFRLLFSAKPRWALAPHTGSRVQLRKTRASTETDTEQQVQVEGIDRSYCDDFVCTSSPQVEQNIKALARDMTRLSSWTMSLFRKDVSYKDAFLSFKGANKYKRLRFVKDVVGSPKVLVTRLRMMDRSRAIVQWRLRGSIAVFPIDIDFESEFELDLITGRVFSHTDRWDLSRLSPPAKLAFTASRAAWSITVRGGNAKDDGSQLVKKITSRFRADDEGQSNNITPDPMGDPTRFFQDNSDPTADLFSLAAIAAFIWLIYQAYAEIAKLK